MADQRLQRMKSISSYRDYCLPDPFHAGVDFVDAVLATALFRCWHIILFFACWSTLITVLNHQGHELTVDPTLLTVMGTVLGFVISYRTTSSFERYNEGRRLWSEIIYATRNFARTIWFHVPDPKPAHGLSEQEKKKTCREIKARMLVEKKTVINLLGAYAVAVKHYLRGEDGIYYEDLYHSVKFLSPYILPPGLPAPLERKRSAANEFTIHAAHTEKSPTELPLPATALHARTSRSTVNEQQGPNDPLTRTIGETGDPKAYCEGRPTRRKRVTLPQNQEKLLYPARMPPKYALFDLFPFSLLIGYFADKGQYKGRKAARLRARLQSMIVSHNLPLELSLYLSSYIAALQARGVGDGSTISALQDALNLLVDGLTGLERILTTPIPFSYATHLWSVTTIYCLLLPFMTWQVLGWLTIPASIIICFFYYGFIAAGEEIENPFGYDKNDLDLDHFTNNIIKEELKALTSVPPPDPSFWAFVPENDFLFAKEKEFERIPPYVWVERGPEEILRALSM